MEKQSPEESNDSEFARLRDEKQPSLVAELWTFVRENKAYWMVPILIVFGLIGILAALSATGAAPFIYTLF